MKDWAVALALAASVGCGYSLEGRGIAVDPSIKKIGVPLFKDTTARPGLDQKVTERVIAELLKRGHFDVVQDQAGVDAVVEGTISNFRFAPVGFGSEAGDKSKLQATRYSVTLTVQVRYAKVGVTEPIWTDQLSVRDETDVGDDPESFFDRDDQVLDRLTQNLAKTVVSSMLEAF